MLILDCFRFLYLKGKRMGGKKKAKALKEAQQKLMEESVRQSHERMQLAHHMVIIINTKCYYDCFY